MTSKRPPSNEQMLFISSIIERVIPLDKALKMEYHRSGKGYTAIRVNGVTYNTSWFVDVYQGPWFVIKVPGFESTTTDSLISMIVYLQSFLLRG